VEVYFGDIVELQSADLILHSVIYIKLASSYP